MSWLDNLNWREAANHDNGIFFDNMQPDWRLIDMMNLTYPVSVATSAEYVELRTFAEALWAKNRLYEAIPDYDIPWQIYDYEPARMGWVRHLQRPELSIPAWFPIGQCCLGEVIGEK